MAEDDDADKTEDPTEKKKEKAKGKGQTAVSMEIKHWVVLFMASMGLVFMAPGIATDIRLLSAKFIEAPDLIPMDDDHLRLILSDTFLLAGLSLAPFVGLLVVVLIASSIAQSGLIWAPSKIKPELSKISILKGAKRMFSLRTVVEFLKGIMKLSLVATVGFALAIPFMDDITLFPIRDISAALDRILTIVIWFSLASFAVMTAIAALDYAYQRYAHIKQLKMSKQEVKDENKQSEGDPHVKARIRQIRAERAQQRMMASVPEADVVITNPTHYAVALSYKMNDMQAPRLVAKGVDSLAFRIREVAEENDIAIVENPPLARALYAVVEIDQEVPSEHYMAVAEIIGYVMRLRGELPPLETGPQ